jgi:hypothetical protein
MANRKIVWKSLRRRKEGLKSSSIFQIMDGAHRSNPKAKTDMDRKEYEDILSGLFQGRHTQLMRTLQRSEPFIESLISSHHGSTHRGRRTSKSVEDKR